VDAAAPEAARLLGCEYWPCPPEYSLGRRAPLVRNDLMLRVADAVIAVWDGRSRGTAFVIRRARALGLPLLVVRLTTKAEEEDPMKTIQEIRESIQASKSNSAWSRGVKAYALELLEDMGEGAAFYGSPADWKDLLNGALDWKQYSWVGCSLIYDSDIAERLCCPSELKKTDNGNRRPNTREEWLDVQTRALHQAERLIRKIADGKAA